MSLQLLDMYCGEGGASEGYRRAGYQVTGVDIKPQPRYPSEFKFVQADALDYLAEADLGEFDLIHTSPPCQARSRASLAATRDSHPSLIGRTRKLLIASGKPWVIENVAMPAKGSEGLRPDLKLCACMFGLPPALRRERWFEISPQIFHMQQPCSHTGPSVSINRRGGRYNGPGPMHNRYIPLEECARMMDIDWMSQRGLGEAIPPAYTEYIGMLFRTWGGDV